MQSCGYANLLAAAALIAISAFAGCSSSTTGNASQAPTSPSEPSDEAASERDPAAAVADAPPLDEEEAWEGEKEAIGGPRADTSDGDHNDGETRTMEVIQGIVLSHRQSVRDCYDKARASKPGLKGDLVIHFVLGPDGAVKKAELNRERSTLKDAELARCAAAAIRAIKFPPSSRGMESTVDYPFDLNP